MTTKGTGKPKPNKGVMFTVIADELRDRITAGQFQPGDRLPPEITLAEEYDVTRTTVRSAYNLLIRDLLVEKRGLAGYFVRKISQRVWTLSDTTGYVDPWRSLTESEGAARTRESTAVHVERGDHPIAGTTLAALFGVESDTRIARRSATRYLDGAPLEIADVYMPYDQVKDSAFMDAEPVDVYELLPGQPRSRDRIIPRNPSPGESARLELPEATSVVEVVRRLETGRDTVMVIRAIYGAVGAVFDSCTLA